MKTQTVPAGTFTGLRLAVDDRLWFAIEKLPYTVQAVSPDGRWVAATKPFAVRHTVLYTVLDTVKGVRGRDNCYGLGYETREQCEEAIERFHDGDAEHSRRHRPIAIGLVKHQRGESILTELRECRP